MFEPVSCQCGKFLEDFLFFGKYKFESWQNTKRLSSNFGKTHLCWFFLAQENEWLRCWIYLGLPQAVFSARNCSGWNFSPNWFFPPRVVFSARLCFWWFWWCLVKMPAHTIYIVDILVFSPVSWLFSPVSWVFPPEKKKKIKHQHKKNSEHHPQRISFHLDRPPGSYQNT